MCTLTKGASIVLLVWLTIIAIVARFVFAGMFDERDEARDLVTSTFGGEHQLRKMTTSAGIEGHASGSFFLFAGEMSGNVQTSSRVTFSWPQKDGTYANSTLPVEKIRERFDEKVDQPTITFNYMTVGFDDDCSHAVRAGLLQSMVDYCVNYAVITCRAEDWPTDIKLPLNN